MGRWASAGLVTPAGKGLSGQGKGVPLKEGPALDRNTNTAPEVPHLLAGGGGDSAWCWGKHGQWRGSANGLQVGSNQPRGRSGAIWVRRLCGCRPLRGPVGVGCGNSQPSPCPLLSPQPPGRRPLSFPTGSSWRPLTLSAPPERGHQGGDGGSAHQEGLGSPGPSSP